MNAQGETKDLVEAIAMASYMLWPHVNRRLTSETGLRSEAHIRGRLAGLQFRAAEVFHDVEQHLLAELRHLRALYEPTGSGR